MGIYEVGTGLSTINGYGSHKITTPERGPAMTLYVKAHHDIKWKVSHAAIPTETATWIEEKSEASLSSGAIAVCEVSKMRGCLDLQVSGGTGVTFDAWLVYQK